MSWDSNLTQVVCPPAPPFRAFGTTPRSAARVPSCSQVRRGNKSDRPSAGSALNRNGPAGLPGYSVAAGPGRRLLESWTGGSEARQFSPSRAVRAFSRSASLVARRADWRRSTFRSRSLTGGAPGATEDVGRRFESGAVAAGIGTCAALGGRVATGVTATRRAGFFSEGVTIGAGCFSRLVFESARPDSIPWPGTFGFPAGWVSGMARWSVQLRALARSPLNSFSDQALPVRYVIPAIVSAVATSRILTRSSCISRSIDMRERRRNGATGSPSSQPARRSPAIF